MTEIMLKPCPFCGAPARTDLLPHSGGPGWVECSSCEIHQYMGDTIEDVASRWNTRALPAQGEPVAWTNEAQLGFLKEPRYDGIPMAMWSKSSGTGQIPLYAATGAGETIFEECAEIALEHVGAEDFGHNAAWSGGYDKACRDIAEAIRLRASNRKTMNAIADAGRAK